MTDPIKLTPKEAEIVTKVKTWLIMHKMPEEHPAVEVASAKVLFREIIEIINEQPLEQEKNV